VIASPLVDVDGFTNAGSVMLVNGTTGTLLSTITGKATDDIKEISVVDAVGRDFYIISLPNFNNKTGKVNVVAY